jgi:hypothetical protein
VIRAVLIFIVILVVTLIVLGSFGAVGPWELLLTIAVAAFLTAVVTRLQRRATTEG